MARGLGRDHAEKRQALRKGAAAYFAQHGFDRASMTGAAKACGVSKALIYHYYPSKEALLADILQAHFDAMVLRAKAAAPGGLDALVRALLDAFEHAGPEHRLQVDSSKWLAEDMRAPILERQRDLVALMSQCLSTLRPELDQDRLRAATMTVFGILNWVSRWHDPAKGMSRAAYTDMALQFIEGGLARI
ncbi:TetR/AcrR family transcriptional regulator [Sagittula sp. SSi028]|uniref:TetR/AcrR family transcriptional regulator n=1 Tax=Sagittula sp. SSi028 TaxID=3400636 RepID=UPI003AF6C927